MKTITDHIEYARSRPHHVRKKLVFTLAGAGTALIALAWLVSALSSNEFAIQGSTFADAIGQEQVATTSANSAPETGQNLAGAASALGSANKPTHIEIVDTSTSTSAAGAAEKTTIPF